MSGPLVSIERTPPCRAPGPAVALLGMDDGACSLSSPGGDFRAQPRPATPHCEVAGNGSLFPGDGRRRCRPRACRSLAPRRVGAGVEPEGAWCPSMQGRSGCDGQPGPPGECGHDQQRDSEGGLGQDVGHVSFRGRDRSRRGPLPDWRCGDSGHHRRQRDCGQSGSGGEVQSRRATEPGLSRRSGAASGGRANLSAAEDLLSEALDGAGSSSRP
jgi:hypothetical protein